MSEERREQIVRVRDVMEERLVVVDGLSSVREAILKMKESGSDAIVVNKRHKDDEYGIVMLSDIAKQVLGADKSPDRVNVYEIMTKPVIGVSPKMDIRYCIRLFEKFGLSAAPVLDGDRLLGIVHYRDIVLKSIESFSTE